MQHRKREYKFKIYDDYEGETFKIVDMYCKEGPVKSVKDLLKSLEVPGCEKVDPTIPPHIPDETPTSDFYNKVYNTYCNPPWNRQPDGFTFASYAGGSPRFFQRECKEDETNQAVETLDTTLYIEVKK